MLGFDHDHRQIGQTELPGYPHLRNFSLRDADNFEKANFEKARHAAEISRTCFAFSFMAADRNWISVPVEIMRAPMAMNSAASFGLVERPPTPTCLPCLRQASMVRA